MKTLVSLLGLVLIFEGLPYATFPAATQNWLRQIVEAKAGVVRGVGVVAVLLGLLFCYLAQRTS
ncbi:MAG: DUF2065 domain-containing protein [Desulfobulbaceae bacterium]|nr:DUF2065 domain-containing protein [Desulfobulbaceae bacterium]